MCDEDASDLASRPDLRALPLQDFDDTAALTRLMDTVATVDTSVAHLCGALGHPALVMLPWLPDWRWGLEGRHTPWYASLELLRQDAAGDWSGVLERLHARLAGLGTG
jgi:hypothetical protein